MNNMCTPEAMDEEEMAEVRGASYICPTCNRYCREDELSNFGGGGICKRCCAKCGECGKDYIVEWHTERRDICGNCLHMLRDAYKEITRGCYVPWKPASDAEAWSTCLDLGKIEDIDAFHQLILKMARYGLAPSGATVTDEAVEASRKFAQWAKGRYVEWSSYSDGARYGDCSCGRHRDPLKDDFWTGGRTAQDMVNFSLARDADRKLSASLNLRYGLERDYPHLFGPGARR